MRKHDKDDNDDFEEDFKPYFDTDDDEDEEEGEEELDEEYLELLEKQAAIEMAQLELVQADLNLRVMNMAIELARNTWFWRFRSTETKLTRIIMYYQALMMTLYPPKEEEPKEE